MLFKYTYIYIYTHTHILYFEQIVQNYYIQIIYK